MMTMQNPMLNSLHSQYCHTTKSGGAQRPMAHQRRASPSLRHRPRKPRGRCGGLAAVYAGEGFVGGGAGSAGGTEDATNIFSVLAENITHTVQANPIAKLATDNLLRADVDVGWGNEMHYLAHHPVHVALVAMVGAVQVGAVQVMELQKVFCYDCTS
jgi:hypothetical protein